MRTCASSTSSNKGAAAFALAVVLTGCATTVNVEEAGAPTVQTPAAVAPAPAAPPRREPPTAAAESAPVKGTQLLSQAVKSYEDADYRSASRQLNAALREPLSAAERASAHKYLAFMSCAAKRVAACRDEFRKAFAADPAFDLTPAEAGHPLWGPAFRRVQADLAAKPAKRPR